MLKTGLQFLLLIALICSVSAENVIADNNKYEKNDTNSPRRDDSGGPDEAGYIWKDSFEDSGPSFSWIDVAEFEGVVEIEHRDDSNRGPFELGFDFTFYGNEYSSIRHCSNGWASFTSTGNFHNNNNIDLPGAEIDNLLAVCFSDWDPSEAGHCYFWTNERDIAVLSWEDIPHVNNGSIGTFQIILKANDVIVFQYDRFSGESSDLVAGIQNEDMDAGFEVNNHQAGYIDDQLAVRFVREYGWIEGKVRSGNNSARVAFARMTLSDGSSILSDNRGAFRFEYIPIDEYTVTGSAPGSINSISDVFEVALGETTAVNLHLPKPEITIDPEQINVAIGMTEKVTETIEIFNRGDGRLEFDLEIGLPDDEGEFGDVQFTRYLNDVIDDWNLHGVTTVGARIFVSGSNNNDDPNYVYEFDFDGELISTVEQPGEDPSPLGMRGLTTDGAYLYGCDGNDDVYISQFTLSGEEIGTIPVPENCSYIAYNPISDHFFVCGRATDIFEIDREGEVLETFEHDLNIYGLTWLSLGFNVGELLITHRIEAGSTRAVSSLDVNNGDINSLMSVDTGFFDEIFGANVTSEYNPLLHTGLFILDDGWDFKLSAVSLGINHSRIKVSKLSGELEPVEQDVLEVLITAEGLLPEFYDMQISINHNAEFGFLDIPIEIEVADEGFDHEYFDFAVQEVTHEFFVDRVRLRGGMLSWGDEIGVFTPEGLCVGAVKWLGKSTLLSANQDDEFTEEIDGFEVGDDPIFMIYDVDIDSVFIAEVTLVEGDFGFQEFGEGRVTLTVEGDVVENEFILHSGWSMISSNIDPDIKELEDVFEAMNIDSSLIIVKADDGRFYSPMHDFNNIETWNYGEAYLIKLRRPGRFSMSGEVLEADTPMHLEAGWSMIPYYPEREMDVRDAFADIAGSLIMVKDDQGRFYIPRYEFSNMDAMRLLEGYHIKLSNVLEFSYPEGGERVAAFEDGIRNPVEGAADRPNTGVNMSVLVMTEAGYQGYQILVISEDENICGSGKIGAEGRVGIAVWGDDPTTEEIDGMRAGEDLHFAVKRNNVVSDIEVNALAGNLFYEENSFTAIALHDMPQVIPQQYYLSDPYPNPFNQQTMIKFGLTVESFVNLRVIDLQGREIQTLITESLPAGHHHLNWQAENVPSGLYILELNSNSGVLISKVLLIR